MPHALDLRSVLVRLDGHADLAVLGADVAGYDAYVTGVRQEYRHVDDATWREGRAAVLGAGGVYEELMGAHAESEVVINLVPGKTLEPKEDQRFVVDGWVTGAFDLNVGQYLTLAAQTVELLGGPRIARIVVPA